MALSTRGKYTAFKIFSVSQDPNTIKRSWITIICLWRMCLFLIKLTLIFFGVDRMCQEPWMMVYHRHYNVECPSFGYRDKCQRSSNHRKLTKVFRGGQFKSVVRFLIFWCWCLLTKKLIVTKRTFHSIWLKVSWSAVGICF